MSRKSNTAQMVELLAPAPVAAPAPKAVPTLAEALASARAEAPDRYRHVTEVTELGSRGQPVRVRIRCEDPQTKLGESVCEGTRVIATQDLFQVRCCAACAERKTRIARRERTKCRDKEARALLAASKASAA